METTRLYIVRAEYAGDVSLHIFFSDGTSQTVDFKPYILAHPHPQYNRYIEPKNFKKFTIEHGNGVWGKNWDMSLPIEQLHRGIGYDAFRSSKLRKVLARTISLIELSA